jgi:hypothetical protein
MRITIDVDGVKFEAASKREGGGSYTLREAKASQVEWKNQDQIINDLRVAVAELEARNHSLSSSIEDMRGRRTELEEALEEARRQAESTWQGLVDEVREELARKHEALKAENATLRKKLLGAEEQLLTWKGYVERAWVENVGVFEHHWPTPRGEVNARAEALEDAARICDEEALDFENISGSYAKGRKDQARTLAHIFRRHAQQARSDGEKKGGADG